MPQILKTLLPQLKESPRNYKQGGKFRIFCNHMCIQKTRVALIITVDNKVVVIDLLKCKPYQARTKNFVPHSQASLVHLDGRLWTVQFFIELSQ